MSAMEDLAVKMLEKMLGPYMPQVVDGIKNGLETVANFKGQLDRIEANQADILHKLNNQANGGPSMGERVLLQAGFVLDIPPNGETDQPYIEGDFNVSDSDNGRTVNGN